MALNQNRPCARTKQIVRYRSAKKPGRALPRVRVVADSFPKSKPGAVENRRTQRTERERESEQKRDKEGKKKKKDIEK